MTTPSLQPTAEDYQQFTEAVGLVETEPGTRIQMTGQDRQKFLHCFCTNNIEQLQPGTGCEAFITTLQGKILGHVNVYCHHEELIVETVQGQSGLLMEHLDRYIIQEDVQLLDQSHAYQQWLLGGQQVPALLEKIAITNPLQDPWDHADISFHVISLSVRNVPWSSSPCYSISGLAEDAPGISSLLREQGAVPCNQAVAETCRIEAGFPWYASDLNANNLPQEVGRDRQAISFTKGCYLGQETIARIDALGHVNRQLRGLRLREGSLPDLGSELFVGDKSVGHITSACYSPGQQGILALAMVARGFDQDGQVVSGPTGMATVCTLPFPTL